MEKVVTPRLSDAQYPLCKSENVTKVKTCQLPDSKTKVDVVLSDGSRCSVQNLGQVFGFVRDQNSKESLAGYIYAINDKHPGVNIWNLADGRTELFASIGASQGLQEGRLRTPKALTVSTFIPVLLRNMMHWANSDEDIQVAGATLASLGVDNCKDVNGKSAVPVFSRSDLEKLAGEASRNR